MVPTESNVDFKENAMLKIQQTCTFLVVRATGYKCDPTRLSFAVSLVGIPQGIIIQPLQIIFLIIIHEM